MTHIRPIPHEVTQDGSDPVAVSSIPMNTTETTNMKQCAHCLEMKPLSDFLRRTGKKAGRSSRRGACRDCRKQRGSLSDGESSYELAGAGALALLAPHGGDEAAQAVLPEPAADGEAAAPAPCRRRRKRRGAKKKRNAALKAEAAPADATTADLAAEDAAESPEPPALAADSEAAAPAPRRRRRKRRGAKKKRNAASSAEAAAASAAAPGAVPAVEAGPPVRQSRPLMRRPLPVPPPRVEGPDASELRPTRQGIVRMRGRTDRGRRWHQETDLETAVTLVKEHAAVVVNRHTILRLYSNKAFRHYILTRDNYTCHFCGEYGDTIDHLLPRAKGGHTTPVNCVCACHECNQSKAARSVDEFIEGGE